MRSSSPSCAASCAACHRGGKACLSIRKHDHFTPTREIRRHARALAHNHHRSSRFRTVRTSAPSIVRSILCSLPSIKPIQNRPHFRFRTNVAHSYRKWLKSRPESGLDWSICSTFERASPPSCAASCAACHRSKVYEPSIRAGLGTAAHYCILLSRTQI